MDEDTSASVRTDEFLTTFEPTRLTPMPTNWPREQPNWRDYDFRSAEELARWSQLRYARYMSQYAMTRGPGGAQT